MRQKSIKQKERKISGRLLGKAFEAYSRLSVYDVIRQAVLKRDGLTAEAYRD